MKHYGDITKLNGAELPAVDVITGGSPCQDLSVAGKRAGLAGERSGLFMEQIRVIKEMRQRDRDNGRTGKLIRPRYMVWENVPGAFSSNSGEDFRAVLEETAHIADENAVVPQPPNGKWTTSGAIMGDEWSIAWRVLDAQFWGVPQRRRRIALVADFGGHTAPEILFERDGLSWDSAQSGESGEGTAGDFEGCTYPPVARSLTRRYDGSPCIDRGPNIVCAGFKLGNSEQARSIGFQEERSPTLNAECGGNKPAICYDMTRANESLLFENHGQDTRFNGPVSVSQTVSATFGMGGNNTPFVAQSRMGTGGNQVPLTFSMQGFGDYRESNQASPCKMRDYKDSTDLVAAVDVRNNRETGEVFGTLQAKENGGQSLNYSGAVRTGYAVRRLTPLECERLQGYPDGWTDIGDWTDSKGKVHKPSDSARYKALGNSIALPPWRWVLLRITAQYERPATLGSLFDGIGGFPLIWERLNGAGTCLWASEIEEFCIAVTKARFGAGISERSDENG